MLVDLRVVCLDDLAFACAICLEPFGETGRCLFLLRFKVREGVGLALQPAAPQEREDRLKDAWRLKRGHRQRSFFRRRTYKLQAYCVTARLRVVTLKRGKRATVEEALPIELGGRLQTRQQNLAKGFGFLLRRRRCLLGLRPEGLDFLLRCGALRDFAFLLPLAIFLFVPFRKLRLD